VNIGAHALKTGKNVLHYTFELTETAVGIRYDSHLCDIPSNEVQDNKEIIKEKYENMELGRLIIKEYPTGHASVFTIRSHIEKLMMKSFKPSVIIIDYADIMRSSRRYDSMRHELKLIYEELRGLSQDMNTPIWTASQANRESANADVVGLENMSEAYGKAMVADVVISLSRKAKEKSTGLGRMFVAKNRAGRDGLLFNVRMDCAKSQITVLDPDQEQTLGEVLIESETSLKDKLKEKWTDIKNSK
jgi:replicative DNA helicase